MLIKYYEDIFGIRIVSQRETRLVNMSVCTIRNIGLLFTGEMSQPILEGPLYLVISEGKIREIGCGNKKYGDICIDANGMTLCPGFIDSHVHPVFGDFTPRQNQIGFIESSLHCGVTSMISAGEVHLPGRPTDPDGVKALAILANKSFRNMRPSGVKVYAGALILEPGLTEDDFRTLSEKGIRIVAEIGIGSIDNLSELKQMTEWARAFGMKILMHVGGTPALGGRTFTPQDVITIEPTVACHLNGAPTSWPVSETLSLIHNLRSTFELVYSGNLFTAYLLCAHIKERNMLPRLILGSDSPSGAGVFPLAMWRMITYLSSMCDIPAEIAVCMASGNTKNTFGLSHGTLVEGAPADIQIIDAPCGARESDAKSAIEAGNIPGIAMVMIDGQIKIKNSRNTPPPNRSVVVETC